MSLIAFLFFILSLSLSSSVGAAQALELPVSDVPLWNGAAYNDAVPSTGADKLHALGITGKGLTTAIIDGGFDLGHAIFDNVNVVHNGAVGATDPDNIFHGTSVAGIALSMAPDSNLWLGEHDGLTDAVVAGDFRKILADAARYGIAAVNVSWGDALEGGYASPEDVAAVKDLTAAAVRELLENGVAVVGAAGNEAMNGRVSFPDGLPGVLSVGALSPYGQTASLSTLYGKPGLFLLAPGVNIHSGYGAGLPGTSVAAPHVTGAITLLKSGARAASAEEITAALYDSAARVVYDPGAWIDVYANWDIVPPDSAREYLGKLAGNGDALNPYIEWLDNIEAALFDNDVTAEELRILNRIAAVAYAIVGNDKENNNAPDSATTFPDTDGDGGADGEALYGADLFAAIMETAGGFDPVTGEFAPLEHTGYGFIQVDAAYRLLTSRRAGLLAQTAALAGSPHAGAFAGFSGALAAVLDQNLVDLFQRFDGQPGAVLARAARQLGPGWAASTLQSSIFGQLGIHRALERRGVPADGRATWADGFGGYRERSESRDGSGYHGSFSGLTVGMEKRSGGALFGGFVSLADHSIRGDDGSSKGNRGVFGLYGGAERGRLSAGWSAAVGIGDYDLARAVDGPAAALVGMNYGALRVGAEGNSAVTSFSARGFAEWGVFERGGWEITPGVEAAFAHMRMGGFTEEGGGGVNLAVRGHGESYAEGGAGVRVSKTFFRGKVPVLTASVKASGLYGAGFGGGMRARFLAGGAEFSVVPERERSGWFAPEAAVSWRAGERVTVSAAYRGRFGRRLAAGTGEVSVGVEW